MDTQPATTTDKQMKPRKPRTVSRKIRAALAHRVRDLLPWDDCARAVGLSPAGLYKARLREEVKQLHEEIKAEYVQEVEAMRAPYKARAFEVANELMQASKSDAVKARMVEFLAGESKGNSVNVAVQVNNQPAAQGYEYAHPSQEVVTIRHAQEKQSNAPLIEDAEIIEQY
tara:strand:- start:17239 stop:17751 length:513 start_codon:yes stop_codon:yes gene_type:complete